jgi:hypothetical protein
MTNVVPFRNKRRDTEDSSPQSNAFRWVARIRHATGEVAELIFDEFEELGQFMEQGPDWTGCRIDIRHYEAAEQSA